MAQIYFDITGNGTAYCVPFMPEVGEAFDFYATPFVGESLVDVTCTDDQGQYVAVPVQEHFQLTMPNTTFLTFHIEFTEYGPPPTPTLRKRHRMPLWMYPMFRA